MSGTTLFEDFLISFYNLFFTAGPIIMIATFDWDVPSTYLKKLENGEL